MRGVVVDDGIGVLQRDLCVVLVVRRAGQDDQRNGHITGDEFGVDGGGQVLVDDAHREGHVVDEDPVGYDHVHIPDQVGAVSVFGDEPVGLRPVQEQGDPFVPKRGRDGNGIAGAVFDQHPIDVVRAVFVDVGPVIVHVRDVGRLQDAGDPFIEDAVAEIILFFGGLLAVVDVHPADVGVRMREVDDDAAGLFGADLFGVELVQITTEDRGDPRDVGDDAAVSRVVVDETVVPDGAALFREVPVAPVAGDRVVAQTGGVVDGQRVQVVAVADRRGDVEGEVAAVLNAVVPVAV